MARMDTDIAVDSGCVCVVCFEVELKLCGLVEPNFLTPRVLHLPQGP